MATYSSNYFGGTPGAPLLRDFQHGARLFTDADQRLAPKVKYLYHVSFNINPNALQGLNFKYQHQNEINMLVKTADLPKFSVQTDTLNQYNRKKVTQVKIEYQPVTIRFHDDNLGVSRQLWENYYGYYFADKEAAEGTTTAYGKTAMKGSRFNRSSFGLANNSTVPFFTDITIYQMAKRNWNSYKLINPVITEWQHDSLDYAASQTAEHTMTLAYEAVAYGNGVVVAGNPPGFALEHYDKTPSPIALAGGGASTGGTTTLGGSAGVLAGIESVFGILGSGNGISFDSALEAAITAVNTYQNAKAMGSKRAVSEAGQLISSGLGQLASIGLGGVRNVSFPVNNPTTTTTAVKRNILGS